MAAQTRYRQPVLICLRDPSLACEGLPLISVTGEIDG